MYFEATGVEPSTPGCSPVHGALPTGRHRRAPELPLPAVGPRPITHPDGDPLVDPRLNSRHSPHLRAARATGRTAGTACPIGPTTFSLRGGMTPPHTASTSTNAYTVAAPRLPQGQVRRRQTTGGRTGVRLDHPGIDDIPLLRCPPHRRTPEEAVTCPFSTAPVPHPRTQPCWHRRRRHCHRCLSRRSTDSQHRRRAGCPAPARAPPGWVSARR
jgi:hypothetical protein